MPRVPNSPPPRMLAVTLVPPRSSQSLPMAGCSRAAANAKAAIAAEVHGCIAGFRWTDLT